MGIFKIVVRLIIGSSWRWSLRPGYETMAAPPVIPLKLQPQSSVSGRSGTIAFLIAGDCARR